MAVASAGPYASLHLAPDRQPHQHPTTHQRLNCNRRIYIVPPARRPTAHNKTMITEFAHGAAQRRVTFSIRSIRVAYMPSHYLKTRLRLHNRKYTTIFCALEVCAWCGCSLVVVSVDEVWHLWAATIPSKNIMLRSSNSSLRSSVVEQTLMPPTDEPAMNRSKAHGKSTVR